MTTRHQTPTPAGASTAAGDSPALSARGRYRARTRALVATLAVGVALATTAPAARASTPAQVGPPARPTAAAPALEVAGVAAPAAAPTVSAAPTASVARTGSVVKVSGTLSGLRPGSKVALQRLDGRRWRTVSTVATSRSKSSAGRYVVRVPTTESGRWFYRVSSAASASQRVGVSRVFTLAVGRGDPASVAYLTDPPARWNPCATIRYRVNLEGAPKGAAADVDGAIARIAAGSGLRFTKVGTTTVVPGAQGRDVLDDYPARTDLVIAFARPGDPRRSKRSAYLPKDSDIVAVGGAFYQLDTVRASGRAWHRIAQGYVVIDRTKKLPSGFGSGHRTGLLGTWGQVLMHELGHAVGLDHPRRSDPTQIMYPATTTKPAVWGAGDLTGLRTVGAASGCLSGGSTATAGSQKAADTVLPVQRTGR